MDNRDDNSRDENGLDFETGPEEKTVQGSVQNPLKHKQTENVRENPNETEERFNPFEDQEEEIGTPQSPSHEVNAPSSSDLSEDEFMMREPGAPAHNNEGYSSDTTQVTDVDYEDYETFDPDDDLDTYDAYLDSEEDIEDDFLAPPSASKGKSLKEGGNKSRMIIYGALGILVLGAAGYFLLGSSEPTNMPVANVAPPANNADIAAEAQQQDVPQVENNYVDPMAVPEDIASQETIDSNISDNFEGNSSEFDQQIVDNSSVNDTGDTQQFEIEDNFSDPLETNDDFQVGEQAFDSMPEDEVVTSSDVVIPDDVFEEENTINQTDDVAVIGELDAVQTDMVDPTSESIPAGNLDTVEIVVPEENQNPSQVMQPTPSQEALPTAAANTNNLPIATVDAVSQGNESSGERNVIVVNNPQDGSIPEDVFFDATIEALESDQAIQNAGPSMVDPRLEPGSRFVVVENIISANSLESELIAAERASTLGRYEAALGFYNKLYSMNKRDPRILMGRAIAMQKTNRTAEAIQAYEELLILHPNNADAVVNLMGLLRQENPVFALDRLMSLRQQYPGNVNIAAQIGLTYADMRNFDESLRYLGIASSLQPENAMHQYNMAIVSERRGDISSAISFYEKALEVDAIHGNSLSVPRERIYDRLSVIRR